VREMAASRWAAMARRRAVHVGVQDRLGGHLKELHPCGRLALMQAGRQDGPALQDTAAALGSQAQHLVLAGAERGLHSGLAQRRTQLSTGVSGIPLG
jgi:hypothetical protein